MCTVTLEDVSRLAAQLDGVSERRRDGLLDRRYHGRLVARQLDGRFARHMMIVADLEHGNADAIEDAVIAAGELQSGN